MSSLPSHVDVCDSVPLLNFDSWKPALAPTPPSARLESWSALRELERRWVHFGWATHVVRNARGNESLFADLASAYLYSLEAAFQRLHAETSTQKFGPWIELRTKHCVVVRGLRTLRHTHAHHLQQVGLGIQSAAFAYSPLAGVDLGGGIAWRWSDLDASTLAGFSTKHSAPIAVADLPKFNAMSTELLALGLMRHAVLEIGRLLVAEGP